MGYCMARSLVRLSLIAALALGGFAFLFSFAWIPVYQASSVDVILSPDELHDRKLIEVVYRTHRHNERRQGDVLLPFRVLGALTALGAAVGLVALREVPKPLVPGIIGMRDRRSS